MVDVAEPDRSRGSEVVGRNTLSPQAARALAEAEARRAMAAKPPAPTEVGGSGGLDPARYGDWERKGLASDF